MNERETRLLASVLATLRAIRQSIDAKREQETSDEDKDTRPQRVDISSEVHLEPAVREYYASEQRDRPQKTRREWLQLGIQTIGMFAAIAAAVFTFSTVYQVTRQANTMTATLTEIQKQTTLIRQQLVGTQAARIEVGFGPSGGSTGLAVFFTNRGIVYGKATFKFTAQVLSLPEEKPLSTPVTYTFSATVPPELKGGIAATEEFPLPGFTPKTFESMQQTKATIKVEGEFSFDNGFGDTESQHICQEWFSYRPPPGVGSNGFVHCDGFQDAIRNLTKARKEQTRHPQ